MVNKLSHKAVSSLHC